MTYRVSENLVTAIPLPPAVLAKLKNPSSSDYNQSEVGSRERLIEQLKESMNMGTFYQILGATGPRLIDIHIVNFSLLQIPFHYAHDIFNAISQARLANVQTYNNYINIAGKNKKFTEAQGAFRDAQQLRLATVGTYSLYINIVGKNKQFTKAQQFTLAQRAYSDARQLGLANAVTYNNYLNKAGKNEPLTVAQRAYNDARQAGLADDNILTLAYLHVCDATSNYPEGVKVLYATNVAVRSEAGSRPMLAALWGFFNAHVTFKEALKLGLADASFYTNYINRAGKNGQFKEAQRAYSDVVKAGLADNIITLAYLHACVATSNYSEGLIVLRTNKAVRDEASSSPALARLWDFFTAQQTRTQDKLDDFQQYIPYL